MVFDGAAADDAVVVVVAVVVFLFALFGVVAVAAFRFIDSINKSLVNTFPVGSTRWMRVQCFWYAF